MTKTGMSALDIINLYLKDDIVNVIDNYMGIHGTYLKWVNFDNKLHARSKTPSLVEVESMGNYKFITLVWHKNGKIHRDKNPAYVCYHNAKLCYHSWFHNGKNYNINNLFSGITYTNNDEIESVDYAISDSSGLIVTDIVTLNKVKNIYMFYI